MNIGYVFIHACVIALGMFQFGVFVGSWNSVSLIFKYNNNWDSDKTNTEGVTVTTVGNVGALIGSFCYFIFTARLNKKATLHVFNIMTVIGIGMQLVSNCMPVFIIGKFIQGFTAGAYSAVAPSFVGDITPAEYNGPIGGVNQALLTFGILMPGLVALPVPNFTLDTTDGGFTYGHKYDDDYLVTSYWIWIIIIPGLFAILQSLLFLTVFNYDTPAEMKKDGNEQKLLHLMRRIYKTEGEVSLRINQINLPAKEVNQDEEKITLGMGLTDPRFRKTTLIGIGTLSFAQLTGMNGVMFYGSTLFASGSISPFVATVIINGFNFVATLISMGILVYVGKRPCMLFAETLCCVGMVMMYLFSGPF